MEVITSQAAVNYILGHHDDGYKQKASNRDSNFTKLPSTWF